MDSCHSSGWSVKPFVPFLKILTSSSLLMAPPGARFCRMARYSVHLYHGRYDFQFISGPPTLVSVYISMFYSDMKLVWVVSGIRSCAPTQALFYLTAWAWNVIWEVGVQSTHEIPSPDGKTVPNHHLNWSKSTGLETAGCHDKRWFSTQCTHAGHSVG